MLKKFVLGTIAAVVLAACGGEGSSGNGNRAFPCCPRDSKPYL